jgi:hypothetical protein
MAKQNPTGHGADAGTATAALDLRDQGVILTHVLALYPASLRLAEVVAEVTAGSADFEAGDRYDRAVTDLIGVGLLFEAGERISPTRAAVRFNEVVTAGL